MKRLSTFVSFILALAALACAGRAAAQGYVIGDQKDKKTWLPPATIRKEIENYQMLKERPTEDIRQVKAEPIVDATGQQLVAIVEGRTLNKPQMDRRVNLLVQYLPKLEDPKEILERRVVLEARITKEWAQAAALAVLAERLGYKATPQEVDQALADLSAQSAQDPGKTNQAVSMLGIPESELRRELTDGIIVEKMLREQVQYFRDEDLKKIFAKDPDFFLEPTRVKAWHLVALMVNRPTDDQVAELKKAIAKYGKRLNKCDTQEEYQALKQEIGQDKGILLTYLDNVAANEPLKPQVLDSLFGMKPGKTSDVIAVPPPPARPQEFHVVKVLERKEGHRGTFEEAKPSLQTVMSEKLKEFTYESLLEKYDIRIDPAGLNEYKEVGRIPAQPAKTAQAQGAPAAAATPAPVAKLNTPFMPRPGSRSSLLGEPPPVEALVGAKAEVPSASGTGKPSLTPEAAKALEAMAGKPQAAPVPGVPKIPSMLSTPATAAPAELEPAQPSATPAPRKTTTRRKSTKERNFNVAPPSVDEVLSRRAREGQ